MAKLDLIREREIRYSPYPVPEEYSREYLHNELIRLQIVIENITRLRIQEFHQAPDKPRQGDLLIADGDDFNPIALGPGLYIYFNGGYKKITIVGPIAVPEASFTLTGYAPAYSNPNP